MHRQNDLLHIQATLCCFERIIASIRITLLIVVVLVVFGQPYVAEAAAIAVTATTTASDCPPKRTATLSVCTGVDCRLDGASDCLRRIQQEAKVRNDQFLVWAEENEEEENTTTSNDSSRRRPHQHEQSLQDAPPPLPTSITTSRNNNVIAVQTRACIGPCGDGPNVLVLNGQGQRVVVPVSSQPNRFGSASLAPPDLFGDNPRGVYQVRTKEQLDFVITLATETAAGPVVVIPTTMMMIPPPKTTTTTTPTTSNTIATTSTTTNTILTTTPPSTENTRSIVTSRRPWYDRPRNERRVLQRLMQFLVLVGLYQYDQSHSSTIGTEQWIVAGTLGLASNWIMRENIIVFLWNKVMRR